MRHVQPFLLIVLFVSSTADGGDGSSADVANAIDQRLAQFWTDSGITPAPVVDDAGFLRRVSLDLIGRIPTLAEYDFFVAADKPTRRTALIRRLLDSPEFAVHFARVLDGIIQDSRAGDAQFLTWLETALRERHPWDAMFRQMLIGPWDSDDSKASIRFLDRRTKDLDALTVDSTRAFFGVDISCARCHDHPLVEDWKQTHYYGMQAFFNRTTGGKGKISTKKDGEVTFVGHDGKEQTAQPMFLSGDFFKPLATSTVGDATQETKDVSVPIRREQLVTMALAEQTFFRRAFVNRVWHWFFGRGLVDPVDQLHSRNVPSVPGLLEWLADDFAASGYDIHRLIESIVLTEAWQRDSRWLSAESEPEARTFAVARLRPLTRQQLAESLLLAVGAPVTNGESELTESSLDWRRQLAEQAKPLVAAFDPKRAGFESSSGEALFLANSDEIQNLIEPDASQNADTFVTRAIRRVLAREASAEEREQLLSLLAADDVVSRKAIIWALAGSAEFRFNH